MTKDELRALMDDALTGEDFNTNEKAEKIREMLEEVYKADDYPALLGLEVSWRDLEEEYQVIKRRDHPGENPLESFLYYVDMGFYPPPEIMLAISLPFERYFHKGGSISLDEAFFGTSYKKRSSYSYKKHKKYKYLVFHNVWVGGMVRKGSDEKQSFEKLAEDYLNSIIAETGFKNNQDIESFLRDYRRWLQYIKSSNKNE